VLAFRINKFLCDVHQVPAEETPHAFVSPRIPSGLEEISSDIRKMSPAKRKCGTTSAEC
jgi:hypothetical protein